MQTLTETTEIQDPTEKHFGDVGILAKYHDNNNNNNKLTYSYTQIFWVSCASRCQGLFSSQFKKRPWDRGCWVPSLCCTCD